MWKYIRKRLFLAVIILLGVSVLIYMLSMLMPTDYIDRQTAPAVANGTMTQDDVMRLKELYGLADKSFFGIIKSYLRWLGGTLREISVFRSCSASLLQRSSTSICGPRLFSR
jgi:peptide/nickel transport system permease protein